MSTRNRIIIVLRGAECGWCVRPTTSPLSLSHLSTRPIMGITLLYFLLFYSQYSNSMNQQYVGTNKQLTMMMPNMIKLTLKWCHECYQLLNWTVPRGIIHIKKLSDSGNFLRILHKLLFLMIIYASYIAKSTCFEWTGKSIFKPWS
jgi:hypothetical protein